MPQTQSIFKKVAVSEKKKIFRLLAQQGAQVLAKTPGDQIFHLIVKQSEKDEMLLCHHTVESKGMSGRQAVLLQFVHEEQRYFMQTDLVFELGWVVVQTTPDLFLLQRRANARVDIPESYFAEFTLTQFAGKAFFQVCKVTDVSAGGFRVTIPTAFQALKVGDQLRGLLRLGARRPLEFQVEVRFVAKPDPIQQIMGVQIIGIDSTMEARLLMLMMDLQRELYLKFQGS